MEEGERRERRREGEEEGEGERESERLKILPTLKFSM